MARDRRRAHRDQHRDQHRDEDDLRIRVLDLLLDKVREDRFPSTTMLDMVEAMLQDDDVDQYAGLLLGKISNDNYPSMDLLRRLEALA